MLLRRLLANRPRQQTFHPHPRLPQNPPKPPLGRPPLRLHCTRSDSSTSKGDSLHSNLNKVPAPRPLKHAYDLPHSSPSTPSTTSSSSPRPSKKRSTTPKQQLPSTTPTPPHQALTRQHLTKQNTTSPLSPTGRLWDHPPLRGWSRRSTPPQKTNPLNPPPVGKAGFEAWVFTKGGLVCTSNMQIGSYCRVSPPDSTCPSRGEVRPNLGCVRV